MTMDFDPNDLVEIKENIKKDHEEFGKWFKRFCPAERLVSAFDMAATCGSCKYNSGSRDFKDRCTILNLRKQLS